MNLLLVFLIVLGIFYLAAVVHNQQRAGERINMWLPAVAWTFLFVFGCGVYYLVAVPKGFTPFDVRQQQAAQQQSAQSAQAMQQVAPAQSNTGRGVNFVNETKSMATVQDRQYTHRLKPGESIPIPLALGGQYAKYVVNGNEFILNLGSPTANRLVTAKITPSGVVQN